MKKLVTWIVFHCAHWAALYGAFALELEGALYVLKFFAWVMVFLAPLLLTTGAQEAAAIDGPFPVRSALTRLQSWATLLLLVWFGHVATAVAWGIVMACVAINREGVNKMRNERATVVA